MAMLGVTGSWNSGSGDWGTGANVDVDIIASLCTVGDGESEMTLVDSGASAGDWLRVAVLWRLEMLVMLSRVLLPVGCDGRELRRRPPLDMRLIGRRA